MKAALVAASVLIILGCVPANAQGPSALFIEVTGADITPELQERLDRIRQMPSTDRVKLVRLSSPANARAIITSKTASDGAPFRFSIDLFDGETLLLGPTRIEQSSTQVEWYGRASTTAGVQIGSAVFSLVEGKLTGSVFTTDRDYEVTALDDSLQVIRQINRGGFPPDHPSGWTPRRPIHKLNAPEPQQDSPIRIPLSVAVFFSPAAAKMIKDKLNQTVDQFATQAVGTANLVYDNSGANLRMSLAKVSVLTAFSETGNWETDRDAFFADQTARDIRTASRANIGVLIFSLSSFCGEAMSIDADADTAFAVVAWTCAVSNLSFTHEIGHLQGAEHNIENASSSPPYPYAHGYIFKTKWRTVMSYAANCACPRLPYFSSPLVMHPVDGVPMGVATSTDNARVLRATGSRISGY